MAHEPLRLRPERVAQHGAAASPRPGDRKTIGASACNKVINMAHLLRARGDKERGKDSTQTSANPASNKKAQKIPRFA